MIANPPAYVAVDTYAGDVPDTLLDAARVKSFIDETEAAVALLEEGVRVIGARDGRVRDQPEREVDFAQRKARPRSARPSIDEAIDPSDHVSSPAASPSMKGRR